MSKDKWNNFELIDKTIISKNSAIYRFKLYNETENIGIPVGQHVACKFQIDGKDEIRYYSPISSQFDQGFFDILVKSYADGVISKKIASLQTGEMVPFKGPVGRMSYSANMAREIGIIAGGSGITPILQVLSFVTTTPEDCTKISLIYANETENDILLREEIDELAEKYPYFKVTYTLTYPSNDWNGESGHITRDMCEKHLPKASDSSRIFICGPPEMNALATDICSELGFAKGSVPSKKEDQVFVF